MYRATNKVRTLYLNGRKYIDVEDIQLLINGKEEIVDKIIDQDTFESKLEFIKEKLEEYPTLELYNTDKHWGVKQKNKKYTHFFILNEKSSYITLLPKEELIPITFISKVSNSKILNVNETLSIHLQSQKRYKNTYTLRLKNREDFKETITLLLKFYNF